MTDQRPDPDQLLERIKEEDARAKRGKLKIFFGASAGVGKTYAMLAAARQQQALGVNVLVGIVETHGRAETEAMTAGLERLPLRETSYRGHMLHEFDLDGALACKPSLILMDELAHSNVAGSRHPKRWQDVEELLAAGIDVYSTVNVQHLETLNDIVGGITGIRVWETVPDRVFDAADEVVLVDLPPDELLQRLKEGKVYLPHQAERAIRNFFRKGNLIALRELALRRTADRVDEEMLQYRRDQSVSSVWQTRESLLVCIGPGRGNDKIIRNAARLAGQLNVPWHAVYVETARLQRLPETHRDQILKTLRLAEENGALASTLPGEDAAVQVVQYARSHNLTKVMAGRDHPRPWRPWYRSFTDRIGQLAPDLDVIQVAREEPEEKPGRWSAKPSQREDEGVNWITYGYSAAVCGLTTLLAWPLYTYFDLANIVMLFLLAVVMVSIRWGRGPGVLASFLSVAIFDFCFVPPRFSFAVSDVQYLMTFAVMLAVGLVTGQLTAGLRYQAQIATQREARVRALYEMARDLSGALMPEQIGEICARFLAIGFEARATILIVDLSEQLVEIHTQSGAAYDRGIAQWAFDHSEAAGSGTDTLPASPVLYLPLQAPMRTRGVLAIEAQNPHRLMAPEQRRLLDTFARLIAIALERVHYVEVAQSTTVQMESERLRNSLLSAISHDLRTPLTALVGLADSFSLTQPPPSGQQQEITAAIREEALRMNALVNNLLDMARLQSGEVRLNLQWQPLEEVVGSALKAMRLPLARHRVRVQLPDDLPLLSFDAVLMERVLSNLLENAAKFTPVGSLIEIGAKAGQGEVEISVTDDGPGLPEGAEEEIFKKFARGQKESATPGVGLGLTICRAIVEAHHGRILAENRPGGGARFVFTLPLGTPPAVEEREDMVTQEPIHS
ncbi:MAG: two-component system sensor histidine kinase KdbD [Rhodocyclaceae bacterium]|nr:MAG: two-component system sensor histidine kinase KdbD [Rhodocyclaceae bacterium]